MDLVDRFGLEDRGMVSLVGGGGKTTSMFKLGEDLKARGYSVLLTTTTGILDPRREGYQADNFFIGEIDRNFRPAKGSITIYGDRLYSTKLKGGDYEFLDRLMEEEVFDFIIIEADGAKMLPIKAPKEGEPVIAKNNSHTIGLIGLDALGEIVEDIVHRPEYFKEIVGEDRLTERLNEEDIVKLILDRRGIFKEARGERIVFLNKADRESRIESAREVRRLLDAQGYDGELIIGDILTGKFY